MDETIQITDSAKAETPSSGEKSKSRLTLVDKVAQSFASLIDANRRCKDSLFTDVLDIMRTITSINAEPELSVGIRVKDERYRFNEYRGLDAIIDLVDSASIKINDQEDAIDVKDRNKWTMTLGKILTPEEFLLANKRIASALRIKEPVYTTLSRSSMQTMGDAAASALVGQKVASLSQSGFTFLKVKLYEDCHYDRKFTEWLAHKVNSMIN